MAVSQYPLQFLFGFAELLLALIGRPLGSKDGEHLQTDSHHGAKCQRVERGRIVVRAIVGHPNHATRATMRLQARGALWL